MNYLDLFSGIGGFRKGFEEAGFEFEWEGHSEIDKSANAVYAKHFPKSKSLGDICGIDPTKLPKIDLVSFGFPCQDLSVSGKQRGLCGERSGLFFEAMRIIQVIRPSIFIFENVKGLFSSQEGRDFKTVLQEISKLGIYGCEWQLCNTSWFLPQNRERVYFIGHSGEGCQFKVFPLGVGYEESNEPTQGKVMQINSNKYGTADRVYNPKGHAVTLKAEGGGLGAKTGLYAIPVITPDRVNKRQNGRRFKEDGDPAFTLTAQDIHGVYTNKGIRRLLPIECERLQGFPDKWTEGFSDSVRYRMLGNAVSVPVVKAIAERLK